MILTGTEFLTMNTRPKIPANARNLNCCIIGSSGSGKTRFWLTPQLLQAHSSYVVVDPKGGVLGQVGGFLQKRGYKIESNRFLLTSTVMYRTQIRLPDICVSCISNADYLRITTCTPCGISTQPICCRKAPANRWRHPCWVMRIRHSWSAPTATRRMWRNSRPQT